MRRMSRPTRSTGRSGVRMTLAQSEEDSISIRNCSGGGVGRGVASGTREGLRAAGGSVAAGGEVASDAVPLPFVKDAGGVELAGRKLAVSFHVVGESGPMTWHANWRIVGI